MNKFLTFIVGVAMGAIYSKEIKEGAKIIKAQQTKKIAEQVAQQIKSTQDDIEDVF